MELGSRVVGTVILVQGAHRLARVSDPHDVAEAATRSTTMVSSLLDRPNFHALTNAERIRSMSMPRLT